LKLTNRADRRPSMQFYPADWTGDAALQACSLAARGLWIEMLLLMWNSPERGVLLKANGSKAEADWLAKMVRADEAEVKQLLSKLEAEGVYSTDAAGRIYSRRMVNDEKHRRSKQEAGRIGGKVSRPRSKTEAKRGSSSSTSSSASSVRTPPISPPRGETDDKEDDMADRETEEFMAEWNRHPFKPIRAMTRQRREKLRTRLREREFRERWREALEIAAHLPWYTGENDRRWRMTVDWFLRNNTNNVKLLEAADGGDDGVDERVWGAGQSSGKE